MSMWVFVLLIAIIVLLIGAMVLLRKDLNKMARSMAVAAAQDVSDVLKAWEKTDEQLAKWSREQLSYLDQQAEKLEDQAEDLYGWTAQKVHDVRARVAKIISPKD